ncbi:MAG: family 10 glycosylhydrolase [Proteiniphilum sp.]|nr:family 10 glycosylhydrolase [Proteiniphilum sp.]
MKKRLIYYIILFALILNGCSKETDDIDVDDPPTTVTLTYPKKEMRAVWMVTAWELDWPRGDHNMASQKQQYITYLEKFKQLHINTLFFQVKGMGDAFYDSPYEPWSESITGVRGQDPGYDILTFMIDEAHKRDIEFHAWMNPYRIDTRASSSQPFAPLHPSVKPEWVMHHEKIQIYNPALPEVRQRLTDIVKDMITKYDVDGIHFDDYFYPDPSSAGQMVSDKTDYEALGADYNTIEAFRRANVDKAIKGVYDLIVNTKPDVVFSVSPAASYTYNLNTLYADVKKWCQEGWIDLLIPQLYQEIGNPVNDFQSNLGWWSQYNYQAALMIGHAIYKFGDPLQHKAFQSTTELTRQYELTRRNKKVSGNSLYSARYLLENKIGITDKIATLYSDPSFIPFMGRSVAPDPRKPENIRIGNGQLQWDISGEVRSVIYYFADLEKEGVIHAVTKEKSITVPSPGFYCVSAINSDNKESEASETVEKK